MTASASPAAGAATAAPPLHPAILAGQAGNVPLTRVSLAYLEHRFKLYLRFGEPARTLRLDDWRRCAVFLPGAMLCRIRWQANDYGTIRWQLMVMQAATPLDATQRIPGVQPGACLLLHAEGDANVRAVLEASGARWESLVDVTVYLTDMAGDFPGYNRVWADHFPDAAVAPCRTTLGITALPTPISIELKCVAHVPERR